MFLFQRRWIPVAKKLPASPGKYWAVCRKSDGSISKPFVCDYAGKINHFVVDTPNGREYETWHHDSAFYGSRVIAWQKFYQPDPYKE